MTRGPGVCGDGLEISSCHSDRGFNQNLFSPSSPIVPNNRAGHDPADCGETRVNKLLSPNP